MKSVGAAVVVSLLLTWGPPVSGQARTSAEDPKPLVRTVAADFAYLVTAPTRMSKADGIKLLAMTGTTLGMIYGVDERMDEEYAVEDESGPLGLGHAASKVGKIYDASTVNLFTLGATGSMALTGLVLKDRKLVQTAGLAAEAFVFTKAVTGVAKLALGRSRPFTDMGSRSFRPMRFPVKTDRRSLPSGHTSSVFALVTVVAKQYPHWYVQLPAYSFGVCVGLQRMESRNHWASDVLVGAAVGYSVGSCLARRHGERSEPRMSLLPAATPQGLGAVVRVPF